MNKEYCISVEAEINSELHKALLRYLNSHPYWDLNRVLNTSLSMFMMQNWSAKDGFGERDYNTCSRVYLNNLLQEHRTHLDYEQNN